MISYRPLFVLLAEKNMKKTDLLQIISSPTLAKLSKGEIIKSDIIEKLCLFLRCQPGDIMEILEVQEFEDDTKLITKPLIIRDNEDFPNPTYKNVQYLSTVDEELGTDELREISE